MARRHHRRYRGLVAANLGALGLNRSVGASDVAVGVAIGVVGAGAARWVENSVLPASWKAYLMQPSGFWAWIHANMAAVGAASAGLLAYFLETKAMKRGGRLFGHGRAYGPALGAVSEGVTVAASVAEQPPAPLHDLGFEEVREEARRGCADRGHVGVDPGPEARRLHQVRFPRSREHAVLHPPRGSGSHDADRDSDRNV